MCGVGAGPPETINYLWGIWSNQQLDGAALCGAPPLLQPLLLGLGHGLSDQNLLVLLQHCPLGRQILTRKYRYSNIITVYMIMTSILNGRTRYVLHCRAVDPH